MSIWWPGEQERFEAFMQSRANRMQTRGEIEMALSATDYAPYIELQTNYGALVFFAQQQKLPPEEEFPDSKVVVNQNIW